MYRDSAIKDYKNNPQNTNKDNYEILDNLVKAWEDKLLQEITQKKKSVSIESSEDLSSTKI